MVAIDVSAERLAELVESLPDSEVLAVPADITAQTGIDSIMATVGDSINALDNMAGINDDFSSAAETSDAVWDRAIAVYLTGGFKLTRAALPFTQAAGRGAIVDVASEAGLRGNATGTV